MLIKVIRVVIGLERQVWGARMIRLLLRPFRLLRRVFLWPLIFLGGYLFNFVFDTQFTIGFIAGWLIKNGFDGIAGWLLGMI